MTDDELVALLGAQRVVPVLRCADADDARRTALACAAGGCRLVELTLSTPGVHAAVRDIARSGAAHVALGTLRDAADVAPAAAAGAVAVVSFAHPPGLLEAARAHGVVPIPGALTPGEVLAARAAPIVKLFPARVVGPAYLRDLAPLLPGLRVMATGGIAADAADVRRWLDAGALCIGIGSALGTAARDGEAAVRDRCRRLLDALGEG